MMWSKITSTLGAIYIVYGAVEAVLFLLLWLVGIQALPSEALLRAYFAHLLLILVPALLMILTGSWLLLRKRRGLIAGILLPIIFGLISFIWWDLPVRGPRTGIEEFLSALTMGSVVSLGSIFLGLLLLWRVLQSRRKNISYSNK